jgi:hypothetical protein
VKEAFDLYIAKKKVVEILQAKDKWYEVEKVKLQKEHWDIRGHLSVEKTRLSEWKEQLIKEIEDEQTRVCGTEESSAGTERDNCESPGTPA